ncbi:MAG: dienelactone hydrolase family protein [Thermoanaerobaculia bacterium]
MLKRIALALAATLAAATLSAQVSGAMMTLMSGEEKVPAFIAAPSDVVKKGGVVVIQEWWGLNDFVKTKAEHFARQGYVVIAPDLYRGQLATTSDQAHQLMRGLPEDRAMRDLQAAVAFLKGRADVDPTKVGVVGWCMGGGYSLSVALAEPALAGAVIYYGRLLTDDATIRSLKPPLMGHFGGKDEGIPVESVKEFERKAKAAGKSIDFKIYREAGHGFASALTDPATFRPEDAKDADARTDAFFKRVLSVKKVTAKKTRTTKKKTAATKPAPKPTPKKP